MTELHVIISPTTIEVKHLQPFVIDKLQFYRIYINDIQVNVSVIR